ncbi:MAG: phosphate acyltransferase PlsX [Streptococcaceae bacterium]|jgi:glycerol-3-phosphate acyltransferase PlsX|nr:phosphate acyltransferase PlsX [Streptococcaceae bacterium]
MKIAIDAMGGDFAPEAVIKGINQAKKNFPEMTFLIFGDEVKIRELLENEKNVEIVPTTEVVDFHDDPLRVIKTKKDSSMVRAIQAVKLGEADAVLSAGSTGALLTAGLLQIGRIKKVERPGLLTTLPTADGRGFDMLDLGANAENKPEHLRDYAILGSYYAKHVRGIENPRVALLSNGAEESKGSAMIKEVHGMLQELNEQSLIHFIGNIEARDILDGIADVVVADGFTGNAVLKAIEGTMSTMFKVLKSTIKNGGLKTKIGGALIKNDLSALKSMGSGVGGAVLFGLKAPLVKAHGNSNPEAIASAIGQVHKMVESQVVGKLVEYYGKKETEIK